jgi:hypothetical protein
MADLNLVWDINICQVCLTALSKNHFFGSPEVEVPETHNRFQPNGQKQEWLIDREMSTFASPKSSPPFNILARLSFACKPSNFSYLSPYEDGTDKVFRNVGT